VSSTRSRRSRGLAPAFTLIELLVVVAIIALLVSILLPSLSKAREQAKSSVCGSRLRSFGQANAIYQSLFKTFAPCDPWELMPFAPPGSTVPNRSPDKPAERVDPAHGWLALFGMDIKPDIRGRGQAYEAWEEFPYGFRLQSTATPDDLWEGFFCPSQNRRNTMTEESGELDPSDDHEGYPVIYKYASGYKVNRMLRSAANASSTGQPVRLPRNLTPPSAPNIFGSCDAYLDAGDGLQYYTAQAVSDDELTAPAECVYLCDSLDYHAGNSDTVSPFDGPSGGSAGMWYLQQGNTPSLALLLGARHLGRANVLYADSHVSRDNLTPRNKRGDLVVASTFGDYVEDPEIGNQFHILPEWRKFKVK